MNASGHASEQDLLLYLDGELGRERLASMAEHLAACAGCRERLHAMDQTLRAFVEAHGRAPDFAVPHHVPHHVPHGGRLSGFAHGGRVAAALAVLAIGSLALFSLRRATEMGGAALPVSPRAAITPGETVTIDARGLCEGRRLPPQPVVSDSVQRQVLRAYGVSHPESGSFEVDYLITPELGGVASVHNLWPEPYRNTVWNAHVKDQLEARLHDLVCSGEVDLPTAQHALATDWITAYKRYFHRNTPLPGPAPVATLIAAWVAF